MARVFLIVLDSFGIGEMEDAVDFGDKGTCTIASCATSPYFQLPNLEKMGLFSIDGVSVKSGRERMADETFLDGKGVVISRMKEASRGKDTTIGHWEIAGVISDKPLPTYPDGFPKQVLDEFVKRTGREVLCNKPYSGTEVIKDYGQEHLDTGKLIVYTSADSVFQIAAHEEVVPVETLYEYCRIAREILQGEHGVGRVIARPFETRDGVFVRTSRRHDFSLTPPADTMLDVLKAAGKSVIAVGKIYDIFAGQGITQHVYTTSNADGIEKTLAYMEEDFDGIVFTNLVDFDMLYGHRNDIDGYAKALAYFDEKLPQLVGGLRKDDVLMITADHGCDPGYTVSTDHSREHTPFLMVAAGLESKNLGTRKTFADIGQTVLKWLNVPGDAIAGTSMSGQ